MRECLDYDDGTRHTCEACAGDLEMLRDALTRSESARREAEENREMADGCLEEVREALVVMGMAEETTLKVAPMFYREAILHLFASERAAREKAERERDEARDNLKLVKWTPNDDRMMEMLVAEKERDEYGARLARVEAALLSLAKVGEDDDGQPVLRISCGFHCETADMAELPLVWAALAEIGGKR